MNREIKFRAWNVTVKRMQTGFTLKELYETKLVQFHILTFMQFTGLKDKNGSEIYENDVLEFGDNYKEQVLVKWGSNCGCCNSVYGFVIDHSHYHHSDGVIIGNIIQNPELLEQSKWLKQ